MGGRLFTVSVRVRGDFSSLGNPGVTPGGMERCYNKVLVSAKSFRVAPY